MFVLAKDPALPVSCTVQGIVNVHITSAAEGPCNVKIPTVKLYSPLLAGAWPQQRVNALLGMPADAVPRGKVLKGGPSGVVAERPLIAAKLAPDKHVLELAIMRTLLVLAKENPVSCILHCAVSVHCVVPGVGPFIAKAPT
jgi:hypothetical protein